MHQALEDLDGVVVIADDIYTSVREGSERWGSKERSRWESGKANEKKPRKKYQIEQR